MGKERQSLEVGSRFGEWEVIGESFSERANMRCLCRCSCGTEMVVLVYTLRRGSTTSCRTCAISTHRQTRSPTHVTWSSMNMRCNNPNYPGYENYGGRGIKICDEWKDFNTFVRDMGPRPEGFSLDRIDVNGNYSKDNCRWASFKEQANNRRNTQWVDYRGATYTISELAELLNINYHTLRSRIKNGHSLDAPVKERNSRDANHA